MKIPKFNKGDVIWIEWEDHFHNYTAGWIDPNGRKEAGGWGPILVESVGIVLGDNGKQVMFAPTYVKDDDCSSGGFSVKLKNCITKYKVLKKAPKEKAKK